MPVQAEFRHGNPRFEDHTPSSAIAGGDVVVIGDTPYICHTPIAANDKGALAKAQGVYRVAKATGGAITGGAKVWWDDTNNRVTTTASTHKQFGFATADGAASDATTVDVYHMPGSPDAT